MKQIFLIVLLMLAFYSCSKENVFDQSPSERTAAHIKALKAELVSAPYGWSVTYFPRTDSLLFSKPSELMQIPQFGFQRDYGYGGHTFSMKFSDNGMVETLADFNAQSVKTSKQSEFEITQNTYTQLSFTTHSYIHKLVNNRFSGASDFLYKGKDLDGNLVFKTASYTEPAREYVVFKKIKEEKDWTNSIQQAYQNKVFFETMQNPQISIHKGGRVYFKSDMKVAVDTDRRYHLFLSIAYFAPKGWTEEIVQGLGSGYTGTTQGLTFRTGIRYSENYTFYDFKREGRKFICELVKRYDPYTKKEYWVSKHLFPEGEETGVVAEIWDEN